MKSLIIKANRDGSYNVPVSKDKHQQYSWMRPKELNTAIREELGKLPLALIGNPIWIDPARNILTLRTDHK